MNTYDIDTLVTVSSSFTSAGAAIDPSTVTLFILDPSGATTTVPMASLTHGGTGVFSYQINASKSGTWTYKFQGTGNIEVTSPDMSFFVRSSAVIRG